MTNSSPPLAERMRPSSFDDYVGQQHLIAKNAPLRQAIEGGTIPSLILWGPPGVGKTTLARIIASHAQLPFYALSAINSGVKDVREAIASARVNNRAILFIDEIHRFSKSQQDSLLAAVEQGIVILIGATTENPSFEVITPLLSRCQVYILEPLGKDELLRLLERAIAQDADLKKKNITIAEHDALLYLSGGDARKLLTLLELVVSVERGGSITITNAGVERCACKIASYDKNGEQHYDLISALIKSIRGSDPNAALYWLARMLQGGEDAKFIARRLLILASEDIGNANPNALLLAADCFQAVSVIGHPESQIILSQTVAYLAASPKSNSAVAAIMKANELAKKTGHLPVPLHLRNAPTKLMQDINYGKDYLYSHNYEGNFAPQEYFPNQLSGQTLYEPGNNPRENELRARLKRLWGNKYGY